MRKRKATKPAVETVKELRFPKHGAENSAGVWWARTGRYKGKEVTITHRDPKSGQVYLEDYRDGGDYGAWVNSDSVTY